MAAPSDKARFFLEQSVPELQELERKKIFSKVEISSINKKRSDFEHKINSRGSSPADYARYAEYEINLESLRKKRTKRLGIKTGNNHFGQRRIFFVLQRATRKFHGDLRLWVQYADFARTQKSYKKLSQILTDMIRLHPTKAEVWIYAASYSFESQGDVMEARSYMQRGLRFCQDSWMLWLEYARLEMLYIAKITARQQILGLGGTEKPAKAIAEDGTDAGQDHVLLPRITGEDLGPSLDTIKQTTKANNFIESRALWGDIPITIYDTAMGRFQDPDFGEQMFDMVAQFNNLPCMSRIHSHIADHLISLKPNHPASLVCQIRAALSGIDILSAEFPRSLTQSLKRFSEVLEAHQTAFVSNPLPVLIGKIVPFFASYLGKDDLDPDIANVLGSIVKKAIARFQMIALPTDPKQAEMAVKIIEACAENNISPLCIATTEWAVETWPSNPRLASLQAVQPATDS
ncbi:U3 snoRNP protein [Agyrium rufum]|nr:U3 snoRNP protein [Agyrium rufum]